VEVSIGGRALWCVWSHKVMVLMSTHSRFNNKAQVLMMYDVSPLLVSLRSRLDLLFRSPMGPALWCLYVVSSWLLLGRAWSLCTPLCLRRLVLFLSL
jgi:hypothetical protein